jgi:4-hydroxy-2-oxoheptanedioate aldolase
VFTGEEARSVVKTTRFMPIGRRPVDGGNTDGEFCMVPPAVYAEHANREKFVVVQVEDHEALAELDAICSVSGIDIVFFGPGDFSHSIGKIGQTDHPDVVAARRKVAEACSRHGKWAGTMATTQNARALMDEGYRFLGMGADVIAIAQYFRAMRNDLEKLAIL